MATIYCNLNTGSGLKKLNEYLLHRSYSNRYHLNSKRSSSFFCNSKKHFHTTYRRKLKIEKGHQSQQVSSERNADYSGTTTEEEKENDVSKAILIWRAVKLPMYYVALVPLTVGSAAAYFQTGIFSARRYFVVLASSVLIITWLNLSNDVYDFDTGADKNKRESVVNLARSRTVTLLAAYSFLALGFMGLTWTSVEAGNMRSIISLACAIICGYIYQCPPFRLSYQGLGEPLCFAAFGPFASTAFYLLQGSTSQMNYLPLSGTILSASILVGFTTSLILFCSHFHQVEEDKAVGKMSPLVTELLCALTLPMGKLVVRYVEDNHKDKQKIFMAKYYCVRLHALFGAALAVGLVVARAVTKKYVPRPIFS